MGGSNVTITSGNGAAVQAFPVYLSATQINAIVASHPGDYLTIFGTGLGPVNVPDNQAPGGAVSPTGLTVQIQAGGQTILPAYAGRSPEFPGEDQINFQLPAADALATGFAVAVTVTVNGTTSNTATLPIAKSGQSCSANASLYWNPATRREASSGKRESQEKQRFNSAPQFLRWSL